MASVDVDKVFEKMGVPASKGKDEETKTVAAANKVKMEKPNTVLCKNEVNQEDDDDEWSQVTTKKEKSEKSITSDIYSMPPKRQAQAAKPKPTEASTR